MHFSLPYTWWHQLGLWRSEYPTVVPLLEAEVEELQWYLRVPSKICDSHKILINHPSLFKLACPNTNSLYVYGLWAGHNTTIRTICTVSASNSRDWQRSAWLQRVAPEKGRRDCQVSQNATEHFVCHRKHFPMLAQLVCSCSSKWAQQYANKIVKATARWPIQSPKSF